MQGAASISLVSGKDRQIFVKELLRICRAEDNNVWDAMAGDTVDLGHLTRLLVGMGSLVQ